SNGASTIALSCAGDTDCTVTPASIPAGGSATVTATPPNGGGIANPMTLTVTADNGSGTQRVNLQLHVFDFELGWGGNTPPTTELQVGQAKSYNFLLADFGQGTFDAPIALSCPTAPAGVSCSFQPGAVAQLSGSVPETVQVQVGAGASAGPLSLDLRGIGGSVQRDLDLPLNLTQFQLAATPARVITAAGTPQTFTVSASSASNYAGTIALTCSVTGNSAALCGIQPGTIEVGQSSTVTITGMTPGSTDFITVTGAGGGTLASTRAEVDAATIFLTATSNATIAGSDAVSVMVNAYSGFTGFTPVITLGCSTPGLVCAFNPATVQPGGSSALTVTGLGGMATSGSIPLTITGTATGLSALTKAVVANNGDFALTGPSRALEPVLPGDPESFPLQMNSLNGLGGAYIAACGSGLSFACSTTPAQVAVIPG